MGDRQPPDEPSDPVQHAQLDNDPNNPGEIQDDDEMDIIGIGHQNAQDLVQNYLEEGNFGLMTRVRSSDQVHAYWWEVRAYNVVTGQSYRLGSRAGGSHEFEMNRSRLMLHQFVDDNDNTLPMVISVVRKTPAGVKWAIDSLWDFQHRVHGAPMRSNWEAFGGVAMDDYDLEFQKAAHLVRFRYEPEDSEPGPAGPQAHYGGRDRQPANA